MRRTSLLLIALALLLHLLDVALALDSDREQAATKKLQLGMILPLSGPLAFFGNDYIRAYEIFKSEHPEVENLIDIHWEDSAYESARAISAFNKLVGTNHADVVLSFGGPMLNALAPIAESRKVPFFATESDKRDCAGRRFCTLFRNEEDQWGQATWRTLRKHGKKNLGIIKNQNQFMNTFVNAIVRTKGADETVSIVLDVPPETTDMRSGMLSLKSKNIDALGVYLLPTSYHGFLNGLKTMRSSPLLVGVEEFLVKESNKGFESAIEGALVIAPHATPSYRAAFSSTYEVSAGFYYTPAVYDFFALLCDTLSARSNLRGLDLVDALHFKGTREGASGRYSVNVSAEGVHSYNFPIAVYKVSTQGITVEDVIEFDSH